MLVVSKVANNSKPKAGNLPEDRELIFATLEATNGNVAQAAKRFGITSQHLHSWLSYKPERRERLTAIRNTYDDDLLDLAQSGLEKSLRSSDGRIRNRAIEIAFRYIGKRRGYIPANYNENSETGEIKVTVVRE